jgi:hypothetical protein
VGDGLLDLEVDELVAGSGEHDVVHAVLALVGRQKDAQVLVQVLRKEGREGRHRLGDGQDDDEEGVEGVEALLVTVISLEGLEIESHAVSISTRGLRREEEQIVIVSELLRGLEPTV